MSCNQVARSARQKKPTRRGHVASDMDRMTIDAHHPSLNYRGYPFIDIRSSTAGGWDTGGQ